MGNSLLLKHGGILESPRETIWGASLDRHFHLLYLQWIGSHEDGVDWPWIFPRKGQERAKLTGRKGFGIKTFQEPNKNGSSFFCTSWGFNWPRMNNSRARSRSNFLRQTNPALWRTSLRTVWNCSRDERPRCWKFSANSKAWSTNPCCKRFYKNVKAITWAKKRVVKGRDNRTDLDLDLSRNGNDGVQRRGRRYQDLSIEIAKNSSTRKMQGLLLFLIRDALKEYYNLINLNHSLILNQRKLKRVMSKAGYKSF